MTKRVWTIVVAVALSITTGVLAKGDDSEHEAKRHYRASWMEGGWGFRFNMPGMARPDAVAAFDVEKMINQVKALDTASWVQINLSQGANGSYYTSPHPDLERVDSSMVPKRDLFGEMLDALNAEGFKVIVYLAAEGPVPERMSKSLNEKWAKYTADKGMTPEEGISRIIVKKYSDRYGSKIAGWWFDHTYNVKRLKFLDLVRAARSGNPDAVIAINVGASPELPTSIYGDYTSGHPTPLIRQLPSWKGNEQAVQIIEKSNYINRSLGHFFPPMQSGWTNGDPCFETGVAIDWTMRIIKAGGAITWAVALDDATNQAPLASFQFKQLMQINESVKEWRKTNKPDAGDGR